MSRVLIVDDEEPCASWSRARSRWTVTTSPPPRRRRGARNPGRPGRRLRPAVDRYPDADHGRHRIGAGGGARSSRDDDFADDRFCRISANALPASTPSPTMSSPSHFRWRTSEPPSPTRWRRGPDIRIVPRSVRYTRAGYPVRRGVSIYAEKRWNTGSPAGACHRARRRRDAVAGDDGLMDGRPQ